MNTGRLIFTQVTDLIHREQFARCMELHPMPRASRGMTARDQFLAMAFAQITFRESLRDIEACLRGCAHHYAMGIRGNITRTNLAYANEQRGGRDGDKSTQIHKKVRRHFRSELFSETMARKVRVDPSVATTLIRGSLLPCYQSGELPQLDIRKRGCSKKLFEASGRWRWPDTCAKAALLQTSGCRNACR